MRNRELKPHMKAKKFVFTKNAYWIGRADATMSDWRAKTKPAPLFRREFTLGAKPVAATLRVCGLGFHETRINGAKAGDHVLDPTPTQFDKRVRFVTHDVTKMLRKGKNAVGVMLGNGWYNSHTADVWHFDKAPWRDHPKLMLQLDIAMQDGTSVSIMSGPEWRVAEGPIRFDGIRNGEFYDAREERDGWDAPGFDDASWAAAAIVPGPGGFLEEQIAPPCKVIDTIKPVSIREIRPGVVTMYDFGVNIAGWVRLTARGEAGREVVLRYGERINDEGELDTKNIGVFCKTGEFQTDRYTFKGGDEAETWEPHFTYHGFRYVRAGHLPPGATLEARVVCSAFAEAGRFETSDETLNKLADITLRAYRSNFVGIPTDCPHREKNGWTGDAQLAVHTGLAAYAATPNYLEWLDSFVDSQRPNGQLSCIVPNAGWGYNWGSGPAWDCALFVIPWACYMETGDVQILEHYYEPMKRYLEYCASITHNGILSFGLGDWCCHDIKRMTPPALTSTAIYFDCLMRMTKIAEILRQPADAKKFSADAAKIKRAFNRDFYRGNGIYGEGQLTALACVLYYDLASSERRRKVFNALVAACRAKNCIADFGILGASWVPRVLSSRDRSDLAYRIITQPEFPGWVNWLKQGATTLWEAWDDGVEWGGGPGGCSRNHIMFGDIYAWMVENIAGLTNSTPGWTNVTIVPWFHYGINDVKAEHITPRGKIAVEWKRRDGKTTGKITLPPGTSASIFLPDRISELEGPGVFTV